MRTRSTWTKNRQADDPRAMNQDHLKQQPKDDAYGIGDPSAFAEDVAKPDWRQEYSGGNTKRNEIGMPEMRTAREYADRKAELSLHIARSIFPTANERILQAQTLAFMSMPDEELVRVAREVEARDAAEKDAKDAAEKDAKDASKDASAKTARDAEEKKDDNKPPPFIQEKIDAKEEKAEEKKKEAAQQDSKEQDSKQAQQQAEDDKKQAQQQAEQDAEAKKQASAQAYQMVMAAQNLIQMGNPAYAQQYLSHVASVLLGQCQPQMAQQMPQLAQQQEQQQQAMAQQQAQQAMAQAQQEQALAQQQQQQALAQQQAQQQAMAQQQQQALAQQQAQQQAMAQGFGDQVVFDDFGGPQMMDNSLGIEMEGIPMDIEEMPQTDPLLDQMFASQGEVQAALAVQAHQNGQFGFQPQPGFQPGFYPQAGMPQPGFNPMMPAMPLPMPALPRTAATKTVGTRPTAGVAQLGGHFDRTASGPDTDLSKIWNAPPDVSSYFK